MLKIMPNSRKRITRMERGQVLVLVAFAAVGIIATIGLVIDVGLMFIGNARLRRATDAAALAAALQYRLNYEQGDLTKTVDEFLRLNGITPAEGYPTTVDTCVTESSLCYDAAKGTTINRKLVKVHTWMEVPLAFLPVINIRSVLVSAVATSETASLDLVMVIDTSESMTFDAPLPQDDPTKSPLRDPTICNDDTKASAYTVTDPSMPGECHPFNEVKTAAVDFVEGLFFPYDRVAVVNFDRIAHNVLTFSDNKVTVENAIKNLQVYEGEGVCDTGQPCRPYCLLQKIKDGYCDSQPNDVKYFLDPAVNPLAVYKGNFDCGDGWYFDPNNLQDPSKCTTTDIGDGLLYAGDEYGGDPPQGRQGALWVVILLTDGSANAGTAQNGDPICPHNTWNPQLNPLCRDSASSTRHCAIADTRDRCILLGNGLPVKPDNPLGIYQAGVWDTYNYDADDYARDMADFVGIEQNALLFTIGLGTQVNKPAADPAGARLLQYTAESVGNGLYFYAPDETQLGDIFKKIGDKIAIRLAQ